MLIRLFDPCKTEPQTNGATVEYVAAWTDKAWKVDVPSLTSEDHYWTITVLDGYVRCDCPAFAKSKPSRLETNCKHIQAFNIAVGEAFLKVMRSMHFNVWQRNGMVMTQVLKEAYPDNILIHSDKPERIKEDHDEGS
jgi:hypothetical protein